MEEEENLSLLDSSSASTNMDAENASLIKNRRHASSYERCVVITYQTFQLLVKTMPSPKRVVQLHAIASSRGKLVVTNIYLSLDSRTIPAHAAASNLSSAP